MAERKHGRLFTEADVNRMLVRGVELQDLNLDTLLEECGDDLTFPADEPLFLLRGQDRAAPSVVGNYADAAKRVGCSEEHFRAALDAMVAMSEWQDAHPDRVKVPD